MKVQNDAFENLSCHSIPFAFLGIQACRGISAQSVVKRWDRFARVKLISLPRKLSITGFHVGEWRTDLIDLRAAPLNVKNLLWHLFLLRWPLQNGYFWQSARQSEMYSVVLCVWCTSCPSHKNPSTLLSTRSISKWCSLSLHHCAIVNNQNYMSTNMKIPVITAVDHSDRLLSGLLGMPRGCGSTFLFPHCIDNKEEILLFI